MNNMKESALFHDARNMLHLIESDLDFLQSHAGSLGDEAIQRLKRMQDVSKSIKKVMNGSAGEGKCLVGKVFTEWFKHWKDAFPNLSLSMNSPSSDDIFVSMDEESLKRVVTNLFINAKEATDEKAMSGGENGGTIVVEERRVPREFLARFLNAKSDFILEKTDFHGEYRLQVGYLRNCAEYLEVAFSDTGCGMNMESLHKAFVEGYSTKKRKSGVGMGVIRSLVSKAGGLIVIKTNIETGTRVSLFLPVVNSKIEIKGRILVVDDMKPVGHSLCSLVRKLGHDASLVSSFEDAKKLLKEKGFDLVISDYFLADKNAEDLMDFMEKEGLKAPVVVCTGDSEMVEQLPNALIKPVSLEELRLALSSIA